MPDPNIALGIRVPQSDAVNPLGTLSQFAQVQNALNQNKLFQQQFAAKQRMGQIFAQSADPEAALATIMKDPVAAPFAGEAMNSYRQGMLALTQQHGQELSQNDSALSGYLKAATSAMSDPSMLPSVTKRVLATLPPNVRERVAPAIDAVNDSLVTGLDKLPEDARLNAFKQRLVGLGISAGLPGPKMSTVTVGPEGRPEQVMSEGVLGAETLPATRGESNALGARSLTGPTMSQKTYTESRVKDMADYEKNLEDRVSTASASRHNFQEVIDAAKDVELGPGAETKMRLGQLLKTIGVTGEGNKVVEGLVKGVAPLQEADKILFANTMNQLKLQLTGVGGSRINQQEFVQSLSKNPSIITDPKALVKVFNLWNQFYDRDRAEQDALDEYKTKGGDITRWPKVWAQSEFMKKFAPGGSISGKDVKGTEGEAKAEKSETKPKRSLEEIFK
jgi:hypothetical protein